MQDRPHTSLLEAKLFPGAGAANPIPRPRLDAPAVLLNGQCSVASLVAPAGYGKSTLMTHWFKALRDAGVRCAWLTLDEDDNDSPRLFRYLIAALNIHDPDLGQDALRQRPTAAGAAVTGSQLESLASDLAAATDRIALFLDDVHCLHNADALRIIEWLINYAPRHVQFVLGGREQPQLRLSGLRLRGKLYELDRRQLMFDMEEAGRFYDSRLEQALSTSELAQLMEKTEGWPAGLQLAALALQGEVHHEKLIDAFTGTDREVVEYLGDVVLGRLDAETRRFLYLAAQFDRINGPVAAAATGLADAQVRLARLYDQGLFLIPLDRRSEWFRFHHLAGEFFRGRTPPGLPASSTLAGEALMRGAQWLHENALAEEAINYAIRAHDWQQACAWVNEQLEETSHARGSHRVVLRWMREIPQEWVDRFPMIPVHYAFSLAFSQRGDEAERQLVRLDQLLPGLAMEPGADTRSLDELRCAVELQRLLLQALCDDGLGARDAARPWLDRWSDAPPARRGDAENVLAFGHTSAGELTEGLAMVAVARQTLTDGGHFYGLAWNAAIEALLYREQGNYVAARSCCAGGQKMLDDHLGGGGALRSVFHVAQAELAYEFDELARALDETERGFVDLDEAAPADWLIMGYLTQARLMLQAGNDDAGLAALQGGQATARARRLPRVEITLAAEECTWLCRRERFEAASAVASRHGFEQFSADPAQPRVASDLLTQIAARMALAHRPTEVATALAPGIADSQRRGLAHREAELLILRAAALHRMGKSREAQAALAGAARLGQSHGYRRVFIDDAELLRPILQGSAPELAWLRELLTPSAVQRDTKGSGSELTKRELRILTRLESGLSNREIAESLFVSEGTLKWHLHNIYGKLDVRNRSGAIAKAKELRLL